jgi:hypothetical protein
VKISFFKLLVTLFDQSKFSNFFKTFVFAVSAALLKLASKWAIETKKKGWEIQISKMTNF